MKKITSFILALIMVFGMLSAIPLKANAQAPLITAEGWPTVTTTTANLRGYINANYGIAVTSAWFEYRAVGSSSWITAGLRTITNQDNREFFHTLPGLQSGTQYEYRACAINTNGQIGTSTPLVRFTTTAANPSITSITIPK